MTRFMTAGSAAAALTLLATPALADCGEVSITEMDWASSAVVTGIASFLMEQGYGCTVTKVPSSTTPALVSVAETGDPDIVTELWTNGLPIFDEMVVSGLITPVADVLSDGGEEGWWIPAYLAEERPELTTLEGLKANAELFEGRFNTCPDGWSCKNSTYDLFFINGMDEAGFELFQHGSGETLATSIAAAYEDRAPWIGYYWSPTAVLGKYPMVKVDLGEVDAEAFECIADAECTGTEPSAYPVSPVKTVVTTDMADREPAIAALMEQVSFTNAQMNDVLAWQQDTGATNDEAAVYFLTNYAEVWSQWIDDTARERLSALISQ